MSTSHCLQNPYTKSLKNPYYRWGQKILTKVVKNLRTPGLVPRFSEISRFSAPVQRHRSEPKRWGPQRPWSVQKVPVIRHKLSPLEGVRLEMVSPRPLIIDIFSFLEGRPKLVGGWTNPSEKYARQIGSLPPNRDEDKKYWAPPPSHLWAILGHLEGVPQP